MARDIRNPKWARDELMLALDLYLRHRRTPPGAKNPETLNLSQLLNQLPIHPFVLRGANFRNPNSVYMKLCNFLAIDPSYEGKGLSSGGKADQAIWDEFASRSEELAQLVSAIRQISQSEEAAQIQEMGEDELEITAQEGRVLARTHFLRERNQKLVDRKKQAFLRNHRTLFCEACSFDFERTYGERGRGFIECHHLLPLAALADGRRTSLKDLALLCSNCHRMVHARKPWLTISELISILIAS